MLIVQNNCQFCSVYVGRMRCYQSQFAGVCGILIAEKDGAIYDNSQSVYRA